MILKILSMAIGLFISQQINAAPFDQNDFCAFNASLKPWIDYPSSEKIFFKGKFEPNPNEERTFCLPSGVEVKLSLDIINKIPFYLQKKYLRKISSTMALTSEFQKFSYPEAEYSVQLRKVYGKECNDKFNESSIELTYCILYEKDISIQDNAYEICFISKTENVNEATQNLILNHAFNNVQINMYNCIIRCLDPEYKTMDFGLFIKKTHPFELDCGSEILLYKVSVNQVTRNFIQN